MNRILDGKWYGPEKNPRYITIGYLNVRQRVVPYALSLDCGGLGLDLLNQVVTQLAANAVWVYIPSLACEYVCLDKVSMPVFNSGPLIECPGNNFVVCPLVHEPLKCLLIKNDFVGTQGLVVTEHETMQIRINECGLISIVLMKGQ